MREELLKGLTEEQIKKVKACKSSEEILNLAKAEGIELTDEQLEAVSGGGCTNATKCEKCGSGDTTVKIRKDKGYVVVRCNKCGHSWNEIHRTGA